MPDPDNEFIDAKEAADYIGCSVRTIEDYARRYRRNPNDPLGLQGIKGPSGWQFKRKWLDDWRLRYDRERQRAEEKRRQK